MLSDNIEAMLIKYDMPPRNVPVYAGFSGGADSTALLLALNELSEKMNFTVRAIHINHMLRGEESSRDEEFCRRLCEKYKIVLYTESVNVKEYSKMYKCSIEQSARILRYEAFNRIASGGIICTAHTADDNAETVIFNLSRGTGLKGLSGIPVIRGNIIRPLLTSSRKEAESYLALKGQDFVTDSSNLTDDYTRNKIRHNVIPVLNGINSGMLRCIGNMTDMLREENNLLEELAGLHSGDDLRGLHTALRRRVISLVLREHNIEVSYELVRRTEEMINSDVNEKINVKSGCYAVINDGKLEIIYDKKPAVNLPEPQIVKIGDNIFFGDKTVTVFVNNSEINSVKSNVHEILTNNMMDCDTIQGDIVLRTRRNGDSYIRYGRDFTSSLKKLFNDRKLPPDERGRIAVLTDDNGIIWVEGFGVADRCKITGKTKKILEVRAVSDNKGESGNQQYL